MIEFYSWVHILTLVLSVGLLFLGLVLFFNLHICKVIKELFNSREQDDIKVLLRNSVLLNPQIQDDIPNIEGYNDLLASYFRILKAQEKQKEEEERRRGEIRRRNLEVDKHKNMLTFGYLFNVQANERNQEEKYNVIIKGTNTIVKYK